MNTNQLKRFATEARNKLKAGIAAKITTLGFDAKGNVSDRMKPELIQNGSIWNGNIQTEAFYHQWMSLYERVQQKGINEVYEEAAYTWFNRLMAIRILQKNDLAAPVMEYADSARTPRIVDEARQGRSPQMPEQMRSRLAELLDDDMKVTEQFALLISAWCHQNPIINACFGGIADYTELLLPNNILAEGQFIDLLNHTEFITDEDYKSPELIGWLYQFYISERKDEVFAKKGKFEADEIPAATQIFTPNWIVKYMVQNTIGRIYLDNNRAETQLKDKWKYLVEPSQPTPKDAILRYGDLTELKVADFACGSGHILNEAFDILYDLYILEGYSRKEAIENIFRYNLTGIDLDTRAKQLAMFALLLKACQKDSSFADAHILPLVLDMPKPYDAEKNGALEGYLHHFFLGEETRQMVKELTEAFNLMDNADSLGSIMKFDLSDSTRLLVKQTMEHWDNETVIPEVIQEQMPAFRLILALTETYSALVMNPPYMGSGNMNALLSRYVKDNYAMGKADLATVFVEMSSHRTAEAGSYAFIIPPSWMFLSTFESLRQNIIANQTIDSLLHLSRGVFGADFGASSAVIRNVKSTNACGTYFRLIERTFQEFEQSHLRILFEQTLADHDFCYRFKDYDKSVASLPHSDDGNKIYYSNIQQNNFKKIPGSPIGYWVSEKSLEILTNNQSLNSHADPKQGFATGDNNRFLRKVWEIDKSVLSKKWIPCSKGGSFRRWYGNIDNAVNWDNDGEEMKSFEGSVIRNPQYYFTKYGASWSTISSDKASFRFYDKKWLFESKGSVCFPKDSSEINLLIGFLNSPLVNHFLKLFAPTLDYHEGPLGRIPYMKVSNPAISSLVSDNISISRLDWDSHETSWDFRRNPIYEEQLQLFVDEIADTMPNVTVDDISDYHAPDLLQPLEVLVNNYKAKWEDLFHQLHRNEEELNRQFIDIYGLQDELTPDVPLSEVTILQQGEITVENNQLKWHDDVLMKQLISYAVGCWMGRYRLDKPGLHIAHPNPSDEELTPYIYNRETFEIDDDGIIPLMANDCGFSDNASIRFSDFIRTVLGEQKHVENLNFVEQKLGKSIEQYFVKDFWKEHKKMYQNRPIYWLFSSKKGSFQCIAYMHRMDAYTAERVRAKYLLPFIEHLQARITELENRASALSTKENKQLETMRKQLEECREYHDRLQVVAEQAISFDLDDGVIVNYAKFGDVLAKIK